MKHNNHFFIIAFLDIDWSGIVEYMIEAVVCAVKTIVFWFIDALLTLLEPAIEGALSSFGDSPTFSNTGTYLANANYFFPLDTCMDLTLAMITFLAIYSAIKIVVKLIPTIG